MPKTVLSILALLLSVHMIAQTTTGIENALEFQKKINKEFKDKEESPLTQKDFESFESLVFFPIDTSLIVKASFVRTPSDTPFVMQTSTDRKPVYMKYGEAHFKIENKSYILSIYQSHRLMTDPQYENYLFLPFTDKSNGEATYAGGRYLDLRIPEGDTIILDFNTAYNPYCAYSGRYSCPTPPKENHLDIKIHAGVMAYKPKTVLSKDTEEHKSK